MSRRVCNKLVVKQIAAIARPGKHSDGNGLYLRVTCGGLAFLRRPEEAGPGVTATGSTCCHPLQRWLDASGRQNFMSP